MNISRRVLAIVLAISGWAVTERVWAQDTSDARPARIAELMEAYADYEQFSGAVLVAEEGRVLYRAGVGFANRELAVKTEPHHRFVIGSMTKAFTAVLALQQVRDGLLELDAPVTRYWPEFPDPSGGDITIRHLLTHRSGLPHWGALDGFLMNESRLSHDPEELVMRYVETGLRFEPGEQEAYSSIGFYTLGLVLEKVTGKTYGELLRKRIFEPLGMSSSSLDDHASLLPGRVAPYRYSFLEAKYENAEYRDPSTTYSTGGIVTTVDDLLKWDQAWYSDQLLPDSLKALVFDPEDNRQAFGWHKSHPGRDGETILWHGGLVTGYRSQITRVPESRRTIILLGNLRDIKTTDITAAILGILEGGELVPPRRSLMKEVLKYAADENANAAIRRFDDILAKDDDDYNTDPLELLLAAVELRSDEALDRAAPLYEHWIKTYADSPYVPLALGHAADCRLRLGEVEPARVLIDRLAELDAENQALPELRRRLDEAGR